MKRIALTLVAGAFALAGCVQTTPSQNTMLGAVGGAAAGAALSSGKDTTKGALIGAALGAVGGTYLGQAQGNNQCYYSDGRGGRYTAACQ